MSRNFSFGSGTGMSRPSEGQSASGRIVKLFVGQGHGFIRMPDRREVFFHRSDLVEGTSITGLSVGDQVTFQLVEDRVSGARAQRVELRRTRR